MTPMMIMIMVRPIMVIITTVIAMIAVIAVMHHCSEHNKSRHRSHDTVIVMRLCRRAGKGYGHQASHRQNSNFVYPLLNHYYLQRCLIMVLLYRGQP
jgi:hypothetical protein